MIGSLIAALIGLSAVAGGQQPAPAKCAEEVRGEGPCPEQIAFHDDKYERMTVSVNVGGKGPYRFLVDTGADRSAISSALVSSLALKTKAEATLHSTTGISDVSIVRVPRMELTTRTIDGLDAPVLEADNMGADGILGVDSLHSQRIVIDFKNGQICLTPSLKREPRLSADEIVVVGRLKQGHLIFTDAKIDGEDVTVVIDTGAQMSIGNMALFRMMSRHRKLSEPVTFEVKSVTGQILAGNLHLAQQLDFDGVSVHNVGIMFADTETFKVIGRNNKPTLLLGMNALRGFTEVAIDLESKKLRLRFPRAST